MILIIGGKHQLKSEFAKTLGIPANKILFNAHKAIETYMREGKIASKEFFKEIRNYEVITCDEVGMGVVPSDEFSREYRETVGRIMCDTARNADEVYRVYCGIPQKIKG